MDGGARRAGARRAGAPAEGRPLGPHSPRVSWPTRGATSATLWSPAALTSHP